jgi:hypothetical protein
MAIMGFSERLKTHASMSKLYIRIIIGNPVAMVTGLGRLNKPHYLKDYY